MRKHKIYLLILLSGLFFLCASSGYAVFGDRYNYLKGKISLTAEAVKKVIPFGTPIRLTIQLKNESNEVLTMPELSEITVLSSVDKVNIHRDGMWREIKLEPGDTIVKTITVTRKFQKPGIHHVSVNYQGVAQTKKVPVRVKGFPGWEEKFRNWEKIMNQNKLKPYKTYFDNHEEDTDVITLELTKRYLQKIIQEYEELPYSIKQETNWGVSEIPKDMDKAIKKFPESKKLKELKGKLLFLRGKDRAAINSLIRSTRHGFDEAVDWYEERHNKEMTDEQFKKFIELGEIIAGKAGQRNFNTMKARTKSAMAYAYYYRGEIDQAIKLAEESIPEVAKEWKKEKK